MLTWPWVGRPSWSELGPAQLCLPGNHGAAAAPPPSPSLPSVHFDFPAPVTAKHNTRPGKICSEQSRAALLLRDGGGVSGPATRHPPPAPRRGGRRPGALCRARRLGLSWLSAWGASLPVFLAATALSRFPSHTTSFTCSSGQVSVFWRIHGVGPRRHSHHPEKTLSAH